MADFRVVVSDSKTGKAYQVVSSGAEANKLIGKKIGDTVNGDSVGLAGYTLKLTGGSDKDGFAMRGDLPGTARRKILVSSGVGYKPPASGVRKRKSMRGNEVSSDVSQVNAVIVDYGQKSLEEIFPPKVEGEGAPAKTEKSTKRR
ncbi:MAG: 30S ribosomal protein S6e [Candidatus Methanoperedens sp.]|jgi:small subunit ribosomal protein S6e|nr:30S ribosomal protein S6e [Candidatus Methanoperedens sp.]PKL53710.1 MAG: 30S ribosomal protein S6e [Candidatus Methanoperedenaceae archaeon HGW-Methanoperedenaceae-1]